MIRGFFIADSPYVAATVQFPWGGDAVPIEFLLDTGSEVSVIQLEALADEESVRRTLESGIRERSFGVGGERTFAAVRVGLTFEEGAEPRELRFSCRVPVEPTPERRLPSLLGMDFLAHFRLTVSRRENVIELTPTF